MTAGTASLLSAARAVEVDVERELSLARLSNPAAIAWLEEQFDETWETVGTWRTRHGYRMSMAGLAGHHVRPMFELLEDGHHEGTPCALCRQWSSAVATTHVITQADLDGFAVMWEGVRQSFARIVRDVTDACESVTDTLRIAGFEWPPDGPSTARPQRRNWPTFAIQDEPFHPGGLILGARRYAASTPADAIALALQETPAPAYLVDAAPMVPGVLVVPNVDQALAAPWGAREPLALPAPPPRTGPPVGRLR